MAHHRDRRPPDRDQAQDRQAESKSRQGPTASVQVQRRTTIPIGTKGIYIINAVATDRSRIAWPARPATIAMPEPIAAIRATDLASGRSLKLRISVARLSDIKSSPGRLVDQVRSPTGSAKLTIVRVTRSAASCWTKWPAPGIVTRVRSLSTQFQVSLSAAGQQGLVLQAVDQEDGALDRGEASLRRLGAASAVAASAASRG